MTVSVQQLCNRIGMIAAITVAAVTLPASAEEPRTHQLTAPDGPSVTLAPADNYLPTKLQFPRPQGTSPVVTVSSVTLEGLKVASSTCDRLEGVNRPAMLTTIKQTSGTDVAMEVSVEPGEGIVHLEVTGFTGDMAVRISGADRVGFATRTTFEAVDLTGDSVKRTLPNCAAVQNRKAQEGVVICRSRGGGMRLVADKTGAVIYIQADGRPFSVTLKSFRGDASLAIEDTAPPTGAPEQVEPSQLDVAPNWIWFSNEGRAFRPLLADQREARIRAGFSHERVSGDIHADLAFGGDLGIRRRQWRNGDVDSLTIRGLVTARLNMNTDSKDVMNNDYYGGFAYGQKRGPYAWEAYVFHQSAHLGDETLDFGKRRRIDYGREVVRFLLAREFGEAPGGRLRVYAGPTQNLTASDDFNKFKTAVQGGAEYEFIGLWGQPMYVAGDLHFREENKWKPHFTAQVGIDLGHPEEVRRHRTRLFVEFYTGYSNMGQYWDEYETSTMVGITFDW